LKVFFTMKKIVYIIFILLFTGNVIIAQKFVAQTSRTKVAAGETFQIQFSLNANGSNFKTSGLNDFDVYSGPNQSTSMSYSNGAMSQSVALSYIIAAKKEGKFTIGPASITVNGATIQSNLLVIEVSKVNANAQNQSSGNQQQQNPTAPTTQNINDNVFVKAVVNKTKVYLGEVIDVNYKVYTRIDMRIGDFTKLPSYVGFFVQETKEKQSQSNETINGITYIVGNLHKTFIIPQHTGKLIVDPFKLDCIVRQKSNKKPHDIWEQMLGGGYEDVVYSLESKPITIDVSALPEANKPAGFANAVGDFTFKAELNKDKVKANDAINLTITLTGKGNIKLVDPLKINFPEDFETYDPKVKDNITTAATGVSGSKTFDYLIIPRHEGDYKIEGINFTYFNPEKKQYITIPSPEFSIHVEKGNEKDVAANVLNPRSKEDVKVLGNDIRYIKTKNINLKPKANYFFASALFYTGLISPFIAFLGFIFIRRKNIELNKDAVAVRSRKATKMAKKRLSIAEQHLKINNKELFYVEIFKALYGYISDKLNIPVADLNKEHISETLQLKNVSADTILKLITTLDNCEYARYAPSAVSGDLNHIYNNTVELITKIENEI